MDQLHQVLHEIEQRNSFLVTSHARPDGDAIGSALAMGQVLRKMGKKAEVVLGDSVPVIYKPLPMSDTIVHASSVNGNFDAAIILECDSVQRTRLEGLDRHFLINIDHHASSKAFANVNWIDPGACAVAEMVFRLALAAQVKITPEIATCLYTAVLTDTGAFSYSPTNARTFELAKWLVEHGADPVKIAQNVYFSSPTSKMRLLGAALSNLHREGAIAWMAVTRQDMERCGALDEDCEGLVNYALGIAGIEVAVFFRELASERVRVSIRSKGAVNVADIAARFGGGGHECASGFSLEGPMGGAAETVLKELRAHMPDAP
ncbi:MAG TPA: bifunctional oligoribonuclease/PAP phosphatase NrnA [Candidatus Limnocylindrales bacterium]|nr:bifunctional oligoribonuclease/PAP phosphatase NrnA [Candidatus Limnocylindrales bacterium]